MARSAKTLLGGRYKLTGELARAASVQRGWDRWLNRHVFIEILERDKIGDCLRQGRFIASARALARIEHPNVAALLDYGASEAGAPYHVMVEDGVDLATLMASEPRVSWARARGILLDVIAGVHALHRQRIIHGGIALHTVALFGETARLVEFGEAEQLDDEPAREQLGVDVRGIAALGFTMLTGSAPTGRSWSSLAAALGRVDVPRNVRAVLVDALTQPQTIELTTLRRELSRGARAIERVPLLARLRSFRVSPSIGLIDAAAGLAAAVMLSIGLWASVASSEVAASSSTFTSEAGHEAGHEDRLPCEHRLDSLGSSSLPERSGPARRGDATEPDVRTRDEAKAPARSAHEQASAVAIPQQSFESARARVQVGSEAQRKLGVTVQSERFDVRRGLSAAALVERGIDLTHGRPTPEDDPRLPIVDGPLRARALFEAACERDYGKGCHMLGVQIAEGMIPDDGAGAAQHYRRGCALDYHRSCAALADLARAGQIVADADRLDAKACRLAGPDSSYCSPRG